MDRGGKNRPWTSSYSFPPKVKLREREIKKNKNRCVSGISSSRLKKCAICKEKKQHRFRCISLEENKKKIPHSKTRKKWGNKSVRIALLFFCKHRGRESEATWIFRPNVQWESHPPVSQNLYAEKKESTLERERERRGESTSSIYAARRRKKRERMTQKNNTWGGEEDLSRNRKFAGKTDCAAKYAPWGFEMPIFYLSLHTNCSAEGKYFFAIL